MDIVYAMTRNVYQMFLPSYRSLMEHNPDAHVYVVCEDSDIGLPVTTVNATEQRWFPAIGEHRTEAFGGYINHLKVCYPELLPLDKVIHLDIDTIICDSLKDLWETDIEGYWCAAVPERQTFYKPFGDHYFNMGVALINLAQMREDDASERMSEYLLSNNRPYADQDAWNRFGKILPLPLRWNEGRPTGTTDKPGVVHYCSYPDWWTNRGIPRRGYLDRYM